MTSSRAAWRWSPDAKSVWDPRGNELEVKLADSLLWSCTKCTSRNAHQLKKCSVCLTPRRDRHLQVLNAIVWPEDLFAVLGRGRWAVGEVLQYCADQQPEIARVALSLGDKLQIEVDSAARKDNLYGSDSLWMARNSRRLAPVTPLMRCVIEGSVADTELALQHGAPTEVRTAFGQTALCFARGRPDLVECLARFGALAPGGGGKAAAGGGAGAAASGAGASGTQPLSARDQAAWDAGHKAYLRYLAELEPTLVAAMCDESDLLPKALVLNIVLRFLRG